MYSRGLIFSLEKRLNFQVGAGMCTTIDLTTKIGQEGFEPPHVQGPKPFALPVSDTPKVFILFLIQKIKENN